VSPVHRRVSVEHVDKPKAEMCRAVTEIVSSERRYVESLRLICQKNMRAFMVYAEEFEQPRVLDIIPGVFCNVEDILKLHEMLMERMEQAMIGTERMISEDPEMFIVYKIPSLFGELAPFLKMYYQYVANHEEAIERLGAFRTANEQFSKFLNVIERAQNQNLPALLIMPVQRIPRYKLLMDRICGLGEKTDIDEDKAELLNKVGTLIEEIAEKLDNDMKMKEKRLMVIEIQEKLFRGKVELVTSSRYFVRMGVLKFNLKPHKNQRFKSFQVIMFNDLLICGSMSKSRASVKYALPIDTMHIVEDTNAKDNNRFMIYHPKFENGIIAMVENEELKMEWIIDLLNCIENCKKVKSRPNQIAV